MSDYEFTSSSRTFKLNLMARQMIPAEGRRVEVWLGRYSGPDDDPQFGWHLRVLFDGPKGEGILIHRFLSFSAKSAAKNMPDAVESIMNEYRTQYE